jgi:ribosomal protein S18 acetylase RimI-like enzyme
VINMQVRPAHLKDHQSLSNLVFFETRSHRHLDWRSPLEWLGDEFFWMLEEGSRVTAALACPEETTGIAWVRLFVHTGYWSAENAWTVLWDLAKRDIGRAGGSKVAAIVQHGWFKNLLEMSGFENRQSIVMLEWKDQLWAANEAHGFRIRMMTESDIPAVVDVDNSSFDPLWHNSHETLRRALAQALIASVAEDEHGIVGYQLTTGSGIRAHLARLAVHPRAQRHGAATALLNHLLGWNTRNGYHILSVNTQSDNHASLHLYQRMGFVRTGESYPVYMFDVPPFL